MNKLLTEIGLNLTTGGDKEITKDMKQTLCYVAKDFDNEVKDVEKLKKKYEMPDGSMVEVSDIRIRVPETLFRPEFVGMQEVGGIHQQVYKVIQDCDYDLRKDLYENIVLSGGTTMYPNLPERLSSELKSLIPPGIKLKVVAPPERYFSVWIGGSILSSLQTFGNMWITKQEYDETGASIVHQKCY